MKEYITPDFLLSLFNSEEVIMASNTDGTQSGSNTDVIMEDINWGNNWR